MSNYGADIRKYTSNVNEEAIAGIVKFCGIALRNKDSSLVAETTTTPSKLT